jgi:cytochrome c oxidase cbb3-type subunit 4
MPDMGLVRGLITVVTLGVFLAICWWAFRPSSRKRFEEDALLPFDERERRRIREDRDRGEGEKESS